LALCSTSSSDAAQLKQLDSHYVPQIDLYKFKYERLNFDDICADDGRRPVRLAEAFDDASPPSASLFLHRLFALIRQACAAYNIYPAFTEAMAGIGECLQQLRLAAESSGNAALSDQIAALITGIEAPSNGRSSGQTSVKMSIAPKKPVF